MGAAPSQGGYLRSSWVVLVCTQTFASRDCVRMRAYMAIATGRRTDEMVHTCIRRDTRTADSVGRAREMQCICVDVNGRRPVPGGDVGHRRTAGVVKVLIEAYIHLSELWL